MQRIFFSSDQLSAELDDRARFRLWHDLYAAHDGRLDFAAPPDRPFSLRFDFAAFGELGVGRFRGTAKHVIRSARHIVTKPSDTFCLVINQDRSELLCSHRGRDTPFAPGAATIFIDHEISEAHGQGEIDLQFVPMPRERLLELVADAEDLAGSLLDPSRPAVRHLKRYIAMVSNGDDVTADAGLVDHIGTTLLDLIALALGTTRDAQEVARMRGLRAARLQEAIVIIRAGFADPAFSPQHVAARLGVSVRYVQDLLQETGQSLTARVLELRLQRAREALADFRHDRTRVSDIALACGFNEVSYFNRCFRRRFGAAPGDYRVRGSR